MNLEEKSILNFDPKKSVSRSRGGLCVIRARSTIQCTHKGPKKVKLSLKGIHCATLKEGMFVLFPKKEEDLRTQTNFFCKGRWGKAINANLKFQDVS